MSKLAELLQSRGVVPTPANPANVANSPAEISRISNISRGDALQSNISPALERRLKAMAQRWEYSDAELIDVLVRARLDPAGWMRAVALDERREQEFRECGLLPKADA